MDIDEEKTDIQKLCKSYGFQELNIPIYIPQNRFSAASLEDTYQLLKFCQLLQLCEEGTATIESTTTKSQEGIIKGAKYKANVDIVLLKELTIKTLHNEIHNQLLIFQPALLEHGININKLRNTDIANLLQLFDYLKKNLKYTDNAVMGWHLYDLYKYLTEIDFFPKYCTEVKKYSFLYDYCVVYEKANDLGYGFSGSIGKDKYTLVRNWIEAYKTQTKNKMQKELE